jgi:uncharacterized membrane protein YqaE (UPF0057 family)
MDLIRIIIAIFLPPVAAFLIVGFGLHFWPNLILTLCFFVPGMIHALWLVVPKRGDRTAAAASGGDS